MQDKLKTFINTWTGIICGDTPENTGQCVGLVSKWMDELNLNTPHEYGNACDLLTNANKNNFDVIYNTPTGFPLPGDVMVWGTSWGGGYGHTGVIVTADVNQFTCFEQNNPTGHAPQINGHSNYNGVLGWLHPRIEIPSSPTVTDNPLLAEWRAEGNTGDMPVGWNGPGGYPTRQAWYTAVTGDTGNVPVGWNGPSASTLPPETPVITEPVQEVSIQPVETPSSPVVEPSSPISGHASQPIPQKSFIQLLKDLITKCLNYLRG